ncbi:tetratricopeptide repeat protein [Iningainema tapete]|uniref:Tetratricopeptide repeat protein n=1 Tax=Iningainema tapete BLCC-T55 TaxID=2748662 RepID=A0A8J7CBD1_9CYAN|nr:tetratricopeptide repeat protein [Iningainema tapete]MBD2778216.1 tetratricopeptide repeat protein [Iningainema tapete BLCC-T55]
MYRLKCLALATMLLSLAVPVLPKTQTMQFLVARTQSTQNLIDEASRLLQVADRQLDKRQITEALETLQRVLGIYREVGDKTRESTTLIIIGLVYENLGQYPKSLEFFGQALAIAKQVGYNSDEFTIGNNNIIIKLLYNNPSQHPKALEFYQKTLATRQQVGDKAGEGTILTVIGFFYDLLQQPLKALQSHQQALAIAKQLGDRSGEVLNLSKIANIYAQNVRQLPKALAFYQQALVISKEIGNKPLQATTLKDIGVVYNQLNQYTKALEFHQQAIAIAKEIGDNVGEQTIQAHIQFVYKNLGQYAKVLESLQQTLASKRKIGDSSGEAQTLLSIGSVYYNLKQYPLALESSQQALAIFHRINSKAGEGIALMNVFQFYLDLKQYPLALKSSEQALAIFRQIKAKREQGIALWAIGQVYSKQGQYAKALEFYQETLAISKEISNLEVEGFILPFIGEVYQKLGQYPKAWEFYQQGLATYKEIGYQEGEAEILNKIGSLLEVQKQPALAIVFYKQSVNITEGIRQDLQGLQKQDLQGSPQQLQQSYVQRFADTYRRLADLLLKQDRVLEAQAVLDLLKVQELEDYLRGVRGNVNTARGIEYLRLEQRLLNKFNSNLTKVVKLGRELGELQKIPASSRTPQQEKRRQEIEAIQRQTKAEFLKFIDSPDVVALVQQLQRTSGGENLNPIILTRLQDNLKQLNQDAVLLYPLILEDRLELVLVTPYAPPIRRSVRVKRSDFNRAIVEFRDALTNRTENAAIPAQKLYNWLIQPLEPALKEANAKTIIYAPDGQLRYIPLAALYDGNQWLVQKYRVNNITALSLTDLNKQPQPLKILAGAFTKGRYVLKVGDSYHPFNGLPFAAKEVENVTAEVANSINLLNSDFNEKETLKRVSNYSILHFATHAAFVTGQPEDSFILFGNGDAANFGKIRLWNLSNIDLVVLSACETGLGEELGDGKEILGFGYLMQEAGARAAVASLWSVDDQATQTLMNAFYTAMKQKKFTKAEALQKTQMTLITNGEHPYYWAPFILIGNGL